MPVALVTGAARGLGRAFAQALAEDGYDCAIHYNTSQEQAIALGETLQTHGVRTVALTADVRQQREAEALIDKTVAALGSIDVLLNNVGNYIQQDLADFPSESWLEMFDSNLHSSFYTSQRALHYMRRQGKGRIINIGFAGAEQIVARPSIAAYSIAKTGVILYSKALAKTEAKHGVTVNVISPGIMENTSAFPKTSIPMGRLGSYEDARAALRYLISEEANYVTGITIELAGGWNL